MTAADAKLLVEPQDGSAFQLGGDLVVIKVRASQTGGQYALMDWLVGPKSFTPGHVHQDFEETFYLLEGELDIEVRDEAKRLGPGSLVRIPAGVRHAYTNPHETPARMLVTNMPGGMEECFERFGIPKNLGDSLEDALPIDLERFVKVARDKHHTEYEFDS